MTNPIRTPIIPPALGRDAVAGAPAPIPVIPVTRRPNRVALVAIGCALAAASGCSDPVTSRSPTIQLFPSYALATVDDFPLPHEIARTTGDTTHSSVLGQGSIFFLFALGTPIGFVQGNGYDYSIVGGAVADSFPLWDSWTFVGYASGNKLIAVADSSGQYQGDTTIFIEKGDSLIGQVELFEGRRRRLAYVPVPL